MAYDWTTFTKKIVIFSDMDKLYRMIATQSGMKSWFLRECRYFEQDGSPLSANEEAKAGTDYLFHWYGYDDTVYEKGTVLTANGTDRFEFTFTGNGQTSMKVMISLSASDMGTLVSLTQYDIPADEHSRGHCHIGCLEGWVFYLANMKSIAEGGVDLRNKNESVKGVLNA